MWLAFMLFTAAASSKSAKTWRNDSSASSSMISSAKVSKYAVISCASLWASLALPRRRFISVADSFSTILIKPFFDQQKPFGDNSQKTRNFSYVKAVINFASSEFTLDVRNPFIGVYHDRTAGVLTRRLIYNADILKVQTDCRIVDYDMRWLIALIS